jgi:hypothetical protein
MPPVPGQPGACQGTLTAAVPGPIRWHLARLAAREANTDNDHVSAYLPYSLKRIFFEFCRRDSEYLNAN